MNEIHFQSEVSTSTSPDIPVSIQGITSIKQYHGKLSIFKHGSTIEQQNMSILLAIPAVPTYIPCHEFLHWLQPILTETTKCIRLLHRTDCDAYCIALQMISPQAASQFITTFAGRPFCDTGTESITLLRLSSAILNLSTDLPDKMITIDLFEHNYAPPISLPLTRGQSTDSSPSVATTSVTGAAAAAAAATAAASTTTTLSPTGSSAPPSPSSTSTSKLELPTCPVCFERLDHAATGRIVTACHHNFHVRCLAAWRGNSCPICRALIHQDHKSRCAKCGTADDLWMCLICGHVGCGRYSNQHALAHATSSGHVYAMEMSTQRVWDYCNEGYVHRLIQATSGKVVELPHPGVASATHGSGSPGGAASSGAAAPSAAMQRSTVGPATDIVMDDMASAKMDALATEYNTLLTSQLEVQREYFERQLSVAAEAAHTALAEAQSRAEAAEAQAAQLQTQLATAQRAQAVATSTAQRIQAELKEARMLLGATESRDDEWESVVKQLKAEHAAQVAALQREKADLQENVSDLLRHLEMSNKVERALAPGDAEGSLMLVGEGSSASRGSARRRGRRR